MAQSTPVIAFDCPYNRETTGDAALFFSSAEDLTDQIKVAEVERERMAETAAQLGNRVRAHYRWPAVTAAFERLAYEVARPRDVDLPPDPNVLRPGTLR